MSNILVDRFLPQPKLQMPKPDEQYVPVKQTNKRYRDEIDVLYKIHDQLAFGDVAVYEGRRKWVMTLVRVEQGLIMKIMDNHLFTLNHNDELLQFHGGQTAGFGPGLLKSRYAVSNLLKDKLGQLPKLGINIHKPPRIVHML